MRRKIIVKYIQVFFFILFGSLNFINAIKTGNLVDWLVYAACMVGLMVVAFSIKKLRDEQKGIVDTPVLKSSKTKK
ncbi:hypothetical protein I5M27_08365 [Adhaeribacter sp. BT258]|uniref:Uncharacterized protein n=1 Tax=Adhaeribacter terrigena TaxID=2793070 RepID=A0ABS1C0R4_9BACT|nr:hypothetical protein [Adhaeribacter terrigena]MBK0402999.1 hypothetical protein [Adhaeribacter terrigena]